MRTGRHHHASSWTAVFTVVAVALFAPASNSVVTAQAPPSGGFLVAPFAGLGGSPGSADGPLAIARFNDPRGLAFDGIGNLYVAESGNHTVRKIAPDGIVSTLAGLAGTIGSTDGTGADARFSGPKGLALAPDGALFVADTDNSTIRKVTAAGVVTTFAGLAGAIGSVDGPGATARFNQPWGITVDGSGNVLVADTFNHTIRKITPAGVVSTISGAPLAPGTTDGPAADARFFLPNGLAIGSDGTLYIGDEVNHTVRKMTPGGLVSTLAGMPGVSGAADGTGSDARFNETEDVVVDGGGNVFVVDEDNFTLRRITPAGVVTTIAGMPGVPGNADGVGTTARFGEMDAIVLDRTGRLFVTDIDNDTIRMVIRQDLVANGDFSGGRTGWSVWQEPDIVWSVAGGVFQFRKANPTSTPSQQAAVFQETGLTALQGAPLVAQFDLGNTSGVRKRLTVLVINGTFSDLAVCTFWLPASAALQTYRMRAHTTQAWTNAAIYFYAASDNLAGDTGNYLLDNVSFRDGPATQSTGRTDCVDPTAPTALGGAASSTLLSNGGFDTGVLAPWTTFGDLNQRISGGVFEFTRPGAPGVPAGVILQATGAAMAVNQVMTATFQLGNSSTVRKRVTVLVHENDFSDLSACTFWLPAGLPLSSYTVRTFATKAWTNATLSFYAGTTGTEEWIRLDNVTFQRTSTAITVGTECFEPSESPSANQGSAAATWGLSR